MMVSSGNYPLNGPSDWWIMIIYPDALWLFNIAMENPLYMEVLMGKSSINGSFFMAMLNSQRVDYYLLG